MPQPLTPQQIARNRARKRGAPPHYMPDPNMMPSPDKTWDDINKTFSGKGSSTLVPPLHLMNMDMIDKAGASAPQPIFHPQPVVPRRSAPSRPHPTHRPPASPRPQLPPVGQGAAPLGSIPSRNSGQPVVRTAALPGIVGNAMNPNRVGQPLPSSVVTGSPNAHSYGNPSAVPVIAPSGYPPAAMNRPAAPPPPVPPASTPWFGRQMMDNTLGTGNHRGDISKFFHGVVDFPSMAFNAAKNVAEGGVAAVRGTYHELHGDYAESQRQAQIADDSWHRTRDTVGGAFGANEGGLLYNAVTAAAQYDGGDTEGAKNTAKGIVRDAALHPFNTAMAVLPMASAGLWAKAAAFEKAAATANGARKVQLLEEASHYRNLAQGGKPGQIVRNAVGKARGTAMANPTGRRIIQNTNYVVQEATNAAKAINNFKSPLPRRPVKPKPGMTLADTGKPTTIDINGRPVVAPLSKDSSWQAHMDAEVQKNQAQLKEKGENSQSPKPDGGIQNSFGWPFKAKKTHESSAITPENDPLWSSKKRYDLKDAMFVTDHGIPSVLVPSDLYEKYHLDKGSFGFNANKASMESKYSLIESHIKTDNQRLAQIEKDINSNVPSTNKPSLKAKQNTILALRERRQKLLEAIDAARAYGGTTAMSWIKLGEPAKNIFAVRRHEDVHYAQLLLGKGDHGNVLSNAPGSPQRFKNNPHYAKASRALADFNPDYAGSEHIEIPAFIGGGHHSLLGLKDEEAASLIEDYVRDLADQHDWEGVERVFRNSHEIAKNAADEVLSTHPNRPPQPPLPQAPQSWIKTLMNEIRGSRAP